MTEIQVSQPDTRDDDPTTEIVIIPDDAPSYPGLDAVKGPSLEPSSPSMTTSGGTARPVSKVRIAGLALTGIGLLVVLFLAYVLVFTNLHYDRAQRRTLSHLGPTAPALSGAFPPEGAPVATLSIPTLHLNVAVVEGTSADDLETGPGLMPDTALPGTAGNAVIAGRRLTFGHPFAHLDDLRPGQMITVNDAYGRFKFVVISAGQVHRGQTDPISPSRTARLTLITSNSLPWPSGRYAVEAILVGQPGGPPPLNAKAPPLSERALGGSSAATPMTILWGGILVIGLIGTGIAYRRSRYRLATYLLSTPILLAIAALALENAVRLLPATL